MLRTALSINFDARIVRELAQLTKRPIKLVVDDPAIRVDYNPIDQYLQKLVFVFVLRPIEEL